RRRALASHEQARGRAPADRSRRRRPERPEMISVSFQRFPHSQGLQLPIYQSDDAAGMDLVAALPEGRDVILNPGERALIPTGLAIELPRGYEAQIRPR